MACGTVVFFVCDKCGRKRHWESEGYGPSLTYFGEILRSDGWSIGREYHYCPEHRPRRRFPREYDHVSHGERKTEDGR